MRYKEAFSLETHGIHDKPKQTKDWGKFFSWKFWQLANKTNARTWPQTSKQTKRQEGNGASWIKEFAYVNFLIRMVFNSYLVAQGVCDSNGGY